MNAQYDVQELLDRTYALLVADDGSLKPESEQELEIVARLLRDLDSFATMPDDRTRAGALQELYDIRCRELDLATRTFRKVLLR